MWANIFAYGYSILGGLLIASATDMRGTGAGIFLLGVTLLAGTLVVAIPMWVLT